MSDLTDAKLDAIISLLARNTIGIEEIQRLVMDGKKKGKPKDYAKAYNQLAEKTITELAEMIGISKQSLSETVGNWVKHGIAYNIGTPTQPKYQGMVRLPE